MNGRGDFGDMDGYIAPDNTRGGVYAGLRGDAVKQLSSSPKWRDNELIGGKRHLQCRFARCKVTLIHREQG